MAQSKQTNHSQMQLGSLPNVWFARKDVIRLIGIFKMSLLALAISGYHNFSGAQAWQHERYLNSWQLLKLKFHTEIWRSFKQMVWYSIHPTTNIEKHPRSSSGCTLGARQERCPRGAGKAPNACTTSRSWANLECQQWIAMIENGGKW